MLNKIRDIFKRDIIRMAIPLLERNGYKVFRRKLGQEVSLEHYSQTLDILPDARMSLSQSFEHLAGLRCDRFLTPIDSPLVMISQIQRSGGTLMARLFDSHPQCHVIPHELKIGYPHEWNWPELDLEESPEQWFKRLDDPTWYRLFLYGYSKYSEAQPSDERLPFLYVSDLAKRIFIEYLESHPASKQRDILNANMTAFFNAWLDNQNLYSGEKKYIVGFVPRMIMYPDSIRRFFTDYPDGRLISIIREPGSWYMSARRHAEEYRDLEQAIKLWNESTEAAVAAYNDHPERVYLVTFEDLISDTSLTMRRLAGFLNLEFSEMLTSPTFNRFKVRADSSFEVTGYGVMKEPLNRAKDLTPDERTYIQTQTFGPLREATRTINALKA